MGLLATHGREGFHRSISILFRCGVLLDEADEEVFLAMRDGWVRCLRPQGLVVQALATTQKIADGGHGLPNLGW